MTSINNRKGKIAKYTTAIIELGFNEIPSKISPFKISSKARVVPQPGQGICHNNFEGPHEDCYIQTDRNKINPFNKDTFEVYYNSAPWSLPKSKTSR